jgi:hypothetical protein
LILWSGLEPVPMNQFEKKGSMDHTFRAKECTYTNQSKSSYLKIIWPILAFARKTTKKVSKKQTLIATMEGVASSHSKK